MGFTISELTSYLVPFRSYRSLLFKNAKCGQRWRQLGHVTYF